MTFKRQAKERNPQKMRKNNQRGRKQESPTNGVKGKVVRHFIRVGETSASSLLGVGHFLRGRNKDGRRAQHGVSRAPWPGPDTTTEWQPLEKSEVRSQANVHCQNSDISLSCSTTEPLRKLWALLSGNRPTWPPAGWLKDQKYFTQSQQNPGVGEG